MEKLPQGHKNHRRFTCPLLFYHRPRVCSISRILLIRLSCLPPSKEVLSQMCTICRMSSPSSILWARHRTLRSLCRRQNSVETLSTTFAARIVRQDFAAKSIKRMNITTGKSPQIVLRNVFVFNDVVLVGQHRYRSFRERQLFLVAIFGESKGFGSNTGKGKQQEQTKDLTFHKNIQGKWNHTVIGLLFKYIIPAYSLRVLHAFVRKNMPLTKAQRTQSFTKTVFAQTTGTSKPLRCSRLSQVFASASPTNSSFMGSHFKLRPTYRAMFKMWQIVAVRMPVSISPMGVLPL